MFSSRDVSEPNKVLKLRKEKSSIVDVAVLNSLFIMCHVNSRFENWRFQDKADCRVYNDLLSKCLIDLHDLETVLLYLVGSMHDVYENRAVLITKNHDGEIHLRISACYTSSAPDVSDILTLGDIRNAIDSSLRMRITSDVKDVIKGIVSWLSWFHFSKEDMYLSTTRSEKERQMKMPTFDERSDRIALCLEPEFYRHGSYERTEERRFPIHYRYGGGALIELLEIAAYHTESIKHWSMIYERLVGEESSKSKAVILHRGARISKHNSCKEVSLAILKTLLTRRRSLPLNSKDIEDFLILDSKDIERFKAVQREYLVDLDDPYDLFPVKRTASKCFASSIITRRNSYIKQLKRHGSIKYQDCCLYTVDSYNVLVVPRRASLLYDQLAMFESPVCKISLACALRHALSLCRYLNWKELDWGRSLSDVLGAPWKLHRITDRLQFVELRRFVEETEGSTQDDYLCLLTYVSRAGYKQTLAEVGLYNAMAAAYSNERNRGNGDIIDSVTYKSLLVQTIKLTSSDRRRGQANSRDGSDEVVDWRKEGQEVFFDIGGDCVIKCGMCEDGKARALKLIRKSSLDENSLHVVGRNEELIVK